MTSERGEEATEGGAEAMEGARRRELAAGGLVSAPPELPPRRASPGSSALDLFSLLDPPARSRQARFEGRPRAAWAPRLPLPRAPGSAVTFVTFVTFRKVGEAAEF